MRAKAAAALLALVIMASAACSSSSSAGPVGPSSVPATAAAITGPYPSLPPYPSVTIVGAAAVTSAGTCVSTDADWTFTTSAPVRVTWRRMYLELPDGRIAGEHVAQLLEPAFIVGGSATMSFPGRWCFEAFSAARVVADFGVRDVLGETRILHAVAVQTTAEGRR